MAERDTPKVVNEITHVRTGPWAVNYHSGDFKNLNYELKAAPTGSNTATYLTHVTMGLVGDSMWGYLIDTKLTLIDGIGDEVFGPIQLQAQGTGLFSKDFRYPLKITDNKALDLSGVNDKGGYYTSCFVFIEGFTAQDPIG